MKYLDEDLESEAIARCTKALYPLDNPTKFRVLKYLLDRFGIVVLMPQEHDKVPDVINQNIHYHQNNLVLAPGLPKSLPENTEKVGDYPTIKDIIIKNITKSEAELLLIMLFYTSNYGKGVFLRSKVIEIYREHGIHNDSRSKNSTGNINTLIRKSLIKSINGEEMGITPDGVQAVHDILNGNTVVKPKVAKTNKRKPKVKQTSAEIIEDNPNQDE